MERAWLCAGLKMLILEAVGWIRYRNALESLMIYDRGLPIIASLGKLGLFKKEINGIYLEFGINQLSAAVTKILMRMEERFI